MEPTFKALGDLGRRLLLDSLFERDGQTLGELSERLPGMTRFGVMKHLRVLEEAGLLTTRKVGRQKLHYLNPVPIRLIHDRWISKYAEPWVGAIAGLKNALEGHPMKEPRHIYQTYIRCTPDTLWDAITNPEMTHRYFHGTRIQSDWKPGSPVVYVMDDGGNAVEGRVIEADRPRKLSYTWSARYNPEVAADPPSRVTWEIERLGGTCRLTLIHDEFPAETATYRGISQGWAAIIASLKSLLETGQPLVLDE